MGARLSQGSRPIEGRKTPSLPQEEIRARFENARIARLATADDSGRPHVVPIVFALVGDAIVSAIDAKPKRSRDLKRLRNIGGNPRVSVLVDVYDEEWSSLWWCRADGRAEILAEGSIFDRAIRRLVDKYEQYGFGSPEGPVIVVDVATWSGWAAAK